MSMCQYTWYLSLRINDNLMGIESEDASTQLLFSNTFHRTIDKDTLDRFTFVGKEFTYFFFLPHEFISHLHIYLTITKSFDFSNFAR